MMIGGGGDGCSRTGHGIGKKRKIHASLVPNVVMILVMTQIPIIPEPTGVTPGRGLLIPL